VKARQTLLRKRFNAFIIDLLVISIIRSFLIYTYIEFMTKYFRALTFDTDFLRNLYVVGNFLTITLFMGYFICSYYISNGKTLGKLVFNLKIKSSRNSELTISECFMRSFGYLFCYLNFFLLFLIPFMTKDEKGLPDWISSTSVIDLEEKEVMEENEAFNLTA
jgi:uncharacterized RDD family membrane protein YckC